MHRNVIAKRILSEVEVDYTTALREYLRYHTTPLILWDHLHHCSFVESLMVLRTPGGGAGSSKNKLKVRTEPWELRTRCIPPQKAKCKPPPAPKYLSMCVCGISFGWLQLEQHKPRNNLKQQGVRSWDQGADSSQDRHELQPTQV